MRRYEDVGPAPRAVLEALCSLIPHDQEIEATVCSMTVTEATTWRVMSVTEDAVIFVEASRVSQEWWSLVVDRREDKEQPADQVDAWIKPLRDVVKVGVKNGVA